MKRIAASLLTIVLLVVSASVRPLGLGDIELLSHLNEPLEARIPLYSLGKVDRDSIHISLGSIEEFRRAGIERPFGLTALRFDIKGKGRNAYIAVTTRKPVGEPFLNFLVDVDWSNGRVLREYTLLLDPPVYGAAIESRVKEAVPAVKGPPSAASERPAPHAPAAAAGRGTTGQGRVQGGGTYGPVQSGDTLWSLAERFRGGSGVSVQQMMLAMLRLNPDAFSQGNVNILHQGAILRIPTTSQAEELSRAQALAEVRRQHAAWQDFRRSLAEQARSAPRPAPAAGSTAAASGTGREESAGGSKSASGTPDGRLKLVSGGTARGGVGAASGETPEISALRSELDRVREEADASRREAEELSGRVEESEGIIKELERLVKLRDADLAALQERLQRAEKGMAEAGRESAMPAGAAPGSAAAPSPPAPSPGSATVPPVGASSTSPSAAAPAGSTAIARKPVPLPPPKGSEKPSGILDLIRSGLGGIVPFDPLLLIGGAILVIVIAVVGVVFSRRRRSEAEEGPASEPPEPAPVVAAVAPAAAAAVPADSTQIIRPGREARAGGAVAAPSAEAQAAQVSQRTSARQAEEDPLAEVNVYLAYERFEQAESLVKDAIDKHPDRPDYRLKLLEIYHAAKNAAAFAGAAALLQDAVGEDHEMMQTARQWWHDLSPGTALFSGPGAETGDAGVLDVTEGEEGSEFALAASRTATELPGGVDTSGGVDFDLGLDFDSDSEDDQRVVGEGTTVDFDLGFGDEAAVGEGGVDFDLEGLGDTDASEAGADAGSGERAIVLPVEDATDLEVTSLGDDTDFDLAPGETTVELESVSAVGADTLPGGDSDLDFDLGGLEEEEGTESAARSAATTDFDLDLDLDTLADTSELPAPEAPHETTVDLDLDLGDERLESLDFDFDAFGAEGEEDQVPRTVELGPEEEGSERLEIPGLEPETEEFTLEIPAEAGATSAAPERDTTVARAFDVSEEDAADTTFDFDLALGDTADLAKAESRQDEGDAGLTNLDLELADTASRADGDEVTELNLDDLRATEGADSGGLDFDLSAFEEEAEPASPGGLDIDFDGLELEAVEGEGELVEPVEDEHEPVDESDAEQNRTLVLGRKGEGRGEEVQTKLDLAQAYLDMGDQDGAKGILAEVMSEGDARQRGEAETLLRSLG